MNYSGFFDKCTVDGRGMVDGQYIEEGILYHLLTPEERAAEDKDPMGFEDEYKYEKVWVVYSFCRYRDTGEFELWDRFLNEITDPELKAEALDMVLYHSSPDF